jgi:hypothetical protein
VLESRFWEASGLTDKERTPPMSQKQEDLLLELFLELSTPDRRKVIKYCRDLLREAKADQTSTE